MLLGGGGGVKWGGGDLWFGTFQVFQCMLQHCIDLPLLHTGEPLQELGDGGPSLRLANRAETGTLVSRKIQAPSSFSGSRSRALQVSHATIGAPLWGVLVIPESRSAVAILSRIGGGANPVASCYDRATVNRMGGDGGGGVLFGAERQAIYAGVPTILGWSRTIGLANSSVYTRSTGYREGTATSN